MATPALSLLLAMASAGRRWNGGGFVLDERPRWQRIRSAILAGSGSGVVLPAFALQAETTSIATAFTAAGSSANAQRQYTFDYWIRKMKAQGVWAKLSHFYMVGDTAAQTLINLRNPGTNNLTVGGAPVFTAPAVAFAGKFDVANAGYKGTGTTMWLDTGITLATLQAAGTFSFGLYAGSGAAQVDMGAYDTTAGALIFTGGQSNPPIGRAVSAGATYGVSGDTNGIGLTAMVRTSSTTCTMYMNGQVLGTPNTTDNVVAPTTPTRTMRFLTANNPGAFSTKPFHGGFFAMQALTAADMDMLYRAMTSILESIQFGDVLVNEAGYAPQAVSAQAVVYGWTLQSVELAAELARQGKTVALVGGWRDISLGAMGGVTANGLNRSDLNVLAAIGGRPRLKLRRSALMSGLADGQINSDPRCMNLLCRQDLDSARNGSSNITVYSTGGIVSASKSGTQITSITTLDGRVFTGTEFHDGTYEGDLIAAALPTSGWTTGRESSAGQSGAELANAGYRGVLPANRPQKVSTGLVDIDPFNTPGVQGSGTIPLVNATYVAETIGQGDALSQAFNFRITLTTDRKVGIPQSAVAPTGYAAATYELFGRLSAAGSGAAYTLADAMLGVAVINGKYDFNNVNGVSTDYQGHAADYVYAVNYAAREVSWQAHLNYVKGLFYYLGQEADARVSGQAVRTSLLTYYLPRDCYLDPHPNDLPYWPGQLYVREMRRLVGDLIWNGVDVTATDGTVPRSIKTVGTSSYSIDSHAIQRFAENTTGTWKVNCEGNFGQSSGGADNISPMPYEICLPQRAHCTNLSASFCFSATHVALGCLRMELTSAQVAQSVAVAMALAIEQGIAMQDVDYTQLRDRLLNPTTNSTRTYALLPGETALVLPQTN